MQTCDCHLRGSNLYISILAVLTLWTTLYQALVIMQNKY